MLPFSAPTPLLCGVFSLHHREGEWAQRFRRWGDALLMYDFSHFRIQKFEQKLIK
ncbi:hypothetical protein OPIT5_21150 [Opitutaceae bacterium TAV5]|nr:hypothetical protein OPIT5_21150 [Opitutaceae bacterium TAV5]